MLPRVLPQTLRRCVSYYPLNTTLRIASGNRREATYASTSLPIANDSSSKPEAYGFSLFCGGCPFDSGLPASGLGGSVLPTLPAFCAGRSAPTGPTTSGVSAALMLAAPTRSALVGAAAGAAFVLGVSDCFL